MDPALTFLTGVALTVGGSLLVVAYLRSRLEGILVDLCGTRERAAFWMAFSDVLLVLVPLAVALFQRPDGGAPVVFELSRQLARSLLGLVGAVVALGVGLGALILPRGPARAA